MHIESKIPLSIFFLVYKYQTRVLWIICDQGQETNEIHSPYWKYLLVIPAGECRLPFSSGFSSLMDSHM